MGDLLVDALRRRFGILVGVALVAAVAFQVLAISVARAWYTGDGTITQPSYAVPTVLTTLGTFCVGVAVVLVLGIVATYVIEAAFAPGLDLDAGEGGVGGVGGAGGAGGAGVGGEGGRGAGGERDEIAAYGSDPETL